MGIGLILGIFILSGGLMRIEVHWFVIKNIKMLFVELIINFVSAEYTKIKVGLYKMNGWLIVPINGLNWSLLIDKRLLIQKWK